MVRNMDMARMSPALRIEVILKSWLAGGTLVAPQACDARAQYFAQFKARAAGGRLACVSGTTTLAAWWKFTSKVLVSHECLHHQPRVHQSPPGGFRWCQTRPE
jgi:hypothetical protein